MTVTPKTRDWCTSQHDYIWEREKGRVVSMHQKFKTIICNQGIIFILCPPLTHHLMFGKDGRRNTSHTQ